MKQTGLFKNSKDINKKLIQKMASPKKSRQTVTVGMMTNNAQSMALAKKVATATDGAQKMLEQMQQQQPGYTMELVTDVKRLSQYIDNCIKNGIVSIDTEGSGLDPILDYTCGMSLYTPGETAIYVPYLHTDMSSNVKEGQLPKSDMSEQLSRISEESYKKLKVIYGNAKYDMRIMLNTLGYKVRPYWDVILASNFLNENEPSGVKYLWDKYVYKQPIQKNLKTYDKLFDKMGFNWFDWNKVYQYAANDALMTYQIYIFQKDFLEKGGKYTVEQDLVETAKLYQDIEVPLIEVLADMEERGISIDQELASNLSKEYNEKMEKVTHKVNEIVKQFDLSVLPSEARSKLTDPVNIGSPTQLGILLYDLLKMKQIDKRGTGEPIILQLKTKHPEHAEFLEIILEYRGLKKMLSTYIEKLPAIVKEKTGKVHCQFQQYGAKTGRQSSKDPNLQNIPSQNEDIRPMFIPEEGNYLFSGDFSQQEPRVLAHMSGDEGLKGYYQAGKDLYSGTASDVYNVPYEDCLKNNPQTGEDQPEGRKMRDSMKSVILGIMYSRGAKAISEQLGTSIERAQEIIDTFFDKFPKVKQYLDKQYELCKELGYVKTAYGRKRRLPDLNLPPYEIRYLTTKELVQDELVVQHVMHEMGNARYTNQKNDIKKYWRDQGIEIKDNGGFIADAERQIVNSIIQGTSADITKKAMLEVENDPELNKLGFKMLLPVHDEIIGEGPKENAVAIKERITEVMVNSCNEVISVPMQVSPEVTERWFGEEIA